MSEIDWGRVGAGVVMIAAGVYLIVLDIIVGFTAGPFAPFVSGLWFGIGLGSVTGGIMAIVSGVRGGC